jgi:CHAP domain|nr:MAG TPA: CHAP domain protein [Herelleviridae sp.]
MKLEEFVKKNIGKKVDYDGRFGAQCVDLFRQYCQDVLCIPHTGGVEGAKDLFINYEKMEKEKRYFSKITGKSFIPGDVAIWADCSTNKYGHVAIIVGTINDDLIVFEQDGFKQDGAKIVLRSTDRLLGALRKK